MLEYNISENPKLQYVNQFLLWFYIVFEKLTPVKFRDVYGFRSAATVNWAKILCFMSFDRGHDTRGHDMRARVKSMSNGMDHAEVMPSACRVMPWWQMPKNSLPMANDICPIWRSHALFDGHMPYLTWSYALLDMSSALFDMSYAHVIFDMSNIFVNGMWHVVTSHMPFMPWRHAILVMPCAMSCQLHAGGMPMSNTAPARHLGHMTKKQHFWPNFGHMPLARNFAMPNVMPFWDFGKCRTKMSCHRRIRVYCPFFFIKPGHSWNPTKMEGTLNSLILIRMT